MSTPTGTILLLSLPPSILCGVDLLTFTTSPQFLGIHSIPPGWHFLYTSETTSESIRDGFWFQIPPPSPSPRPPIIKRWDPESCRLVFCSDAEEEKGGDLLRDENVWRNRLMPYRQQANAGSEKEDSSIWPLLTTHITTPLLTRLTNPTPPTSHRTTYHLSTTSCSLQDTDHIPGLSTSTSTSYSHNQEQELGFLGIDLKRTWREGAVGRERTEAVLDRSFKLGELQQLFNTAEGGGDAITGEMEFCYLMVLTLANYSCLEEWKRVLGLVLTCRRAVRAQEPWFANILALLRRQLERCADVEGGLFDMSDEGGAFLKGLFRGFKLILGQVFGEDEGGHVKAEMGTLEEFLRGEYGWELGDDFVRRGMLELEDGEQVEMEMDEMEGEDERGEYAPVIVEL